MTTRLRCYACNVDIHKSYYVRHLWSRRHLRNVSQNVPACLQETDENKILRLRQILGINREI